MLRTVDRAVFTPRPRVDSALIGLERIGPGGRAPTSRRWSATAFAHRRKSLARSLELRAARASARPARAALVELGLARRRARRAAGAGAVRGARGGARGRRPPVMTLRAPAKLNLCLYLGGAPRRRAARAALAVLPAAAQRPDRGLARPRARPTRWSAAGVEGPNLVGVALEAMRARGWSAAAAAGRDREADPGRRRARRRQRRRGRDPAARRGRARRARRARGRARRRRALAARARRSRSSPAPARWSSRCRRRASSRVVLIPDDEGLGDGRRLRRGGLARARARAGRSSSGSRRGCARRPAAAPRRSTTPSCSSTTSSRRRSRCARGSPRRWRRSRRSGRSSRWSPARGRPRSGCSRTSSPPTRPPSALPPRYANAIVSAPQRLG